MSAKLKQLKERKAELTKQLRTANDALSAAPTDPVKQKDWTDRSAEMTNLAGEIEREERVSALETIAPDTRAGLPGGTTQPGDNPLQERQQSEPQNPVLNPDAHGYSLLRALRLRCDGRVVDGVEGEVHAELAKRQGKAAQGLLIPHTLRIHHPAAEQRGTIVNLAQGAGAIPAILAPNLIDVLRNMVILRTLGAQILSDMVGTFAIPRKTVNTGFEWVAEGAGATATDVVIGTVAFAEKVLTGWTKITRSFMKQTSLDAEALVRQDLVDGMAVGLDNGGINGTGASNQPTGLLAAAGVTTTAGGTNGLALTWANVVKQETSIANLNGAVGSLAYLTNSKVRGQAKTTLKDAGSGLFLFEKNEMNGYPVGVSNLVPSNLTKGASGAVCSASIFGNFADAIFALWGGLDLVVDPFTESTLGNVRITAFQSADFNIRRAASFDKNVDILA